MVVESNQNRLNSMNSSLSRSKDKYHPSDLLFEVKLNQSSLVMFLELTCSIIEHFKGL